MDKELAEIIRANPGANIIMDNDCWWLNSAEKDKDGEVVTLYKGDEPPERNLLITVLAMQDITCERC